jgi:hypothetical protein
MTDDLASLDQTPFECIRQVDSDGNVFWSGRDLVSVLGYASWQRLSRVYEEVYTSFCLQDTFQNEISLSSQRVQIGSGATREVEDWRLSASALTRVLERIAGHKPEFVHKIRGHNQARLRVETEIGAVLIDFCEHAGLQVSHQKRLDGYLFDYCVADTLLIEVDEAQHQNDLMQRQRDQTKNLLAEQYGYKLLRLTLPIESSAKLCGLVVQALME